MKWTPHNGDWSGSSARRTRRSGIERLENRQLLAYSAELVRDIYPNTESSSPDSVTPAGDFFYFVADDGLHGRELWRSDGTSAETSMVKDIRPGSASSSPDNLTRVGETLFFSAFDPGRPTRPRLWKRDGTSDGTMLVKDVNIPSGPAFFAWNGLLYFNGEDPATGAVDWWRSDGTADGTVRIKDFAPLDISGGIYRYLYADETTMFLVAAGGLWRSDGTAEGTVFVAPREPDFLVKFDGMYYFDGSFGSDYALWRSDGTVEGTAVFKAFSYPNQVDEIRLSNDHLIFHVSGQLWSSDGTVQGTSLLRTLAIVFNGSPSYFVEFNGAVYFVARDVQTDAREIWKTDGTNEGTLRVAVLHEDPNRTGPRPCVVGDKLFLRNDDGVHGVEPWFLDTNDTLHATSDIFAGTFGSDPGQFWDVGGVAYFAARNNVVGRELWRVVPRAASPTVTATATLADLQTQAGLIVDRNLVDGTEVSHIKVSNIANGKLFLHDGISEIHNGQFVSFDEAGLGFKFTPNEGFVGTASFQVQASTSASDAGLGGDPVTANITVLEGLGTDGDDNLDMRASDDDGTMLEVFDLNGPTPGEPVFTWPMNATVRLPIDTLAGNDVIHIELPEGTSGPAAGIHIDAGGGGNALLVLGGSVNVDAIATGGSLDIIVARGAEMRTSRFDGAALTLIDEGAKATIVSGGTLPSVLTSLDIAEGATLEVTDNALAIDYTGTSPVATIRDKILSGRGGSGLGKDWKGTGITSSTVAQGNMSEPESQSVGYAENALLPLGAYSNFRGVPVDDTSVLIAYTRTGDANLDGVVDNNDVTILGANYAPGVPKPAWALGDFDYNGFVDNDDVTLLGAFYNPGAAPAPVPSKSGASGDGQSTTYEVQSAKFTVATTAAANEIHGKHVVTGHSTAAAAHNWQRRSAPQEGFAREKTFGQIEVRGQSATGGRAQRKSADRERLIDLLAEAVARNRFSMEQRSVRAIDDGTRRAKLWDDGRVLRHTSLLGY